MSITKTSGRRIGDQRASILPLSPEAGLRSKSWTKGHSQWRLFPARARIMLSPGSDFRPSPAARLILDGKEFAFDDEERQVVARYPHDSDPRRDVLIVRQMHGTSEWTRRAFQLADIEEAIDRGWIEFIDGTCARNFNGCCGWYGLGETDDV